ncbi:MAG: glutamate racemase [Treponema sp.]|uniref:glutamate racemase n=1 Tax=Treponema sp. TaxID=166 RepID=UPI003FA249C5
MGKKYVFLDSGIGGLPYFRSFHQQAPHTSAVYVADLEHFPYGEKTRDEVIRYAITVTEKIIARFHPELIVIVCNTMSTAALDALRKTFSIPFIGTVPAVKVAAECSVCKHIGIIATARTIHDPYLEKLIQSFASDCKIEKRADAELVAQIENGLITAPDEEKRRAVAPAIRQFKEAGADTLVLACTHFLHLAETFAECAAPTIKVVDSLSGVISHLMEVLPPVAEPEDSRSCCYVTGTITEDIDRLYRGYCTLFDLEWKGAL